MDWAEVVGRFPARFLVWMASLAAIAFVLLVIATLVSLYVTGESFHIAGLLFGPNHTEIPAGAVIASTVPCDQLGREWEPFSEASGRVIVGVQELVGHSANTDMAGLKPGTVRLSNHDKGGTIIQVMGIPPVLLMPLAAPIQKAWSPVPSENFALVTIPNNSQVVAADAPLRFNILPPYVALNYCTSQKVR